jgi:aspartate kinase
MKVYKFGGASVKNADNIRNVGEIIRGGIEAKKETNAPGLVVVVSAIGSTTDKLVEIFRSHQKRGDYGHLLYSLQAYHIAILKELFGADHLAAPVYEKCRFLFREVERTLDFPPVDPDIFYDELLSFGEILSSIILANYLSNIKLKAVWRDARDIIKTDDEFGRANVLWEEAAAAAMSLRDSWLSPDVAEVTVTQGFIGTTRNNLTTTLGREGSDFSAAVLANCFDAESLTLWKDVPGLMNADPKIVHDAELIEELPYREAAEMMYHGANLIHVKTIQPLAVKGIPLYVRSFVNPELKGTRIHDCHIKERIHSQPIIVFKEDQVRISCTLANLAFMTELHLQQIFMILHQHFLRPEMIEHSAFGVAFTLDFDEAHVKTLIDRLAKDYEVAYKVGLTLMTVKNQGSKTVEVIDRFKDIGKVIGHQHTGPVAQLLLERSQINTLLTAPN